MFASSDSRERLFVSDVLHKARIEVNENGTDAAAVTVAALAKDEEAPSVKMIPFTPVFKADRPFVFLIRDTRTGTILFSWDGFLNREAKAEPLPISTSAFPG